MMTTVAATAPDGRLQRDALTWWAYGVFVALAFFLYGQAAVLLAVRDDLGVSRTVQGLHSTAFAAGLIVGGLVADRLRARIGWGGVFRLSAVGHGAATVGLAGAGSVAGTLPAALVLGLSASLLIVLTPSVLAAAHGDRTAAALSEVNGVASVVGVLAPLVVGASIALTGEWSPAYLLVVVLAFPLLDLWERRLGLLRSVGHEPRAHGRLPRRYWRWWLVLLLVVAVEFTVLLWAADDAEDRLGLSGAAAATAPSAFLVGMAAARVFGGRLALRVPVVTLLRLALVVCVAGFALYRAGDAVVLAYLGLAVSGAGTGLLYPLALATAIERAQGRAPLATARSTLASGLAIGLGPLALGAMADATSVATAFLIVPLLALGAWLASWERGIA
jgi:MFS family permease